MVNIRHDRIALKTTYLKILNTNAKPNQARVGFWIASQAMLNQRFYAAQACCRLGLVLAILPKP